MPVNAQQYQSMVTALAAKGVQLVAVSKTKPVADILELYQLGQLDFGENYVQELAEKQAALPSEIRWHFIGHLQTNKVKYIAPFVHLIHGIDSEKLLREVSRQAAKNNRVIHCLLQVHIASEDTKFGLDAKELFALMDTLHKEPAAFENVKVAGLMGMASFSDDPALVRSEFRYLKSLFNQAKERLGSGHPFTTLSMGMSGDYTIAIEEGSTMVRIGSLLFGARIN
jgi:PLP dependent protein